MNQRWKLTASVRADHHYDSAVSLFGWLKMVSLFLLVISFLSGRIYQMNADHLLAQFLNTRLKFTLQISKFMKCIYSTLFLPRNPEHWFSLKMRLGQNALLNNNFWDFSCSCLCSISIQDSASKKPSLHYLLFKYGLQCTCSEYGKFWQRVIDWSAGALWIGAVCYTTGSFARQPLVPSSAVSRWISWMAHCDPSVGSA